MIDRGIRVFLLDEHPLIRDGLKLRLSSTTSRCDVVGEAGSASEALASLEQIEADVLVTNIGPKELGDVDLEQFAANLTSRLAMLISTRRVHLHALGRAMRAGVRGCMLQDASPAQLVDAVHVVAAGGIFIGPEVADHLFRDAQPGCHLTSRETCVLRLIGQGRPSKVIAKGLGISLRTVESHRRSIKRKLCLDGTAALVRYAVENLEQGGP